MRMRDALLTLAGAFLFACTGCSSPVGAKANLVSAGPATSSLSKEAVLGKQIFFDPRLSASGKLACASCHSPHHAYAPANARAVQLGGPDLQTPGLRAAPSLRYVLNRTPKWSHIRANSLAEQLSERDSVPTGGFAWDGRFDTLRDQAMFPLFASSEMANKDAAGLAAKIADANYASAFRAAFGADIFANPAKTIANATLAVERFELEDPSFHPYSSKFDAWMDGKTTLTPQELHGKQLFDDPASGNCASCHTDQRGANGAHPIFTDYQFEALGVPRNRALATAGYDLGLCGPVRADPVSKNQSYCGLFKTPTLRNVTTRAVFFHNGRFHNLRETLHFYVERDTNPDRWYAIGPHGRVQKFDDLPAADRGNVDVIDAPLTRQRGERPIWNEQDISDVIAFLTTLQDADVAAK
jgi:cytochrome c peroxidase